MDITRNSYAQWEVKMIQSLLIATQFLLQRGRGTSEAGGGARDAGSLGALLERRLRVWFGRWVQIGWGNLIVPLHHPSDGPPPRSGEEFSDHRAYRYRQTCAEVAE